MPDPPAGPPPTEVTAELAALSAALDQVVPAKSATNLLVATWNIRAFDRYTPTWRSAADDSPIRDYSNVAHIAEIVSRFDVIAIPRTCRSPRTAARHRARARAVLYVWPFSAQCHFHGHSRAPDRLHRHPPVGVDGRIRRGRIVLYTSETNLER
jgi:hypothetical protein